MSAKPGLLLRSWCIGACWALTWLAPAAAEARWTVVGGSADLTTDAALTCVRYDEPNPCPLYQRASLAASSHTQATFEIVPGTVTEPYLTTVALVPRSGTHSARTEETALPFEDGSRCVSTTTTTDSGIANLTGAPSWLAVFQEFTTLADLHLTDIASDLDVPDQPTVSRTTAERGECVLERSDTFDVPLEGALEGAVLWGLEDTDLVTDYSRPRVSRCPATAACDRRISGVTRVTAQRVPGFSWADGSGRFELVKTMRWSVEVRQGGTSRPDPEQPGQPNADEESDGTSLWDYACGVGDPVAGFAAGFAGLVSETPASALGPLGIALGVANLGCTGADLWDTPVDDPESAIATGACAGLTSFSFGMGVGSTFLAGTGAGLPAAAVGGFISLVSGAGATIACSSLDSADFRTRAARRGDDFRTIARPQRVALEVARMPRGTPRAVRARLNAAARGMGAMLGAHTAMLRCQVRAQAAATAGDRRWQRRQLACAAGNARRVADGFRAQGRLNGRLARTIRASGMRVPKVDVRRARRTPPAATRQLRRMGASRAEIRRVRTLTAHRARAVRIPRSLNAALTAAGTRQAYAGAARAFDDLARRLSG